MITNSIELSNISKSFSDKTVLNNISITISKGEIFGLLGPSGAGKTTLIKILTGQLQAQSGTGKVLGYPIERIPGEILTRTGMMLDNTGLYERLSCYDNLRMFTRIYGVAKSEIFKVLEQVGLSDCAKRPVSQLSKGMQGRLKLARAILHAPELLILDEPTGGLDPSTANDIHSLLQEQRDSGVTVFLTTHNMDEASKVCNNIALLNEGRLVEYGRPDEICRKHNKENIINILLKDGRTLSLPNSAASATEVTQLLMKDMIKTIHSSEPDLETVFMKLTGRGLE